MFFQQLVNGLTIGSTYALVAIGFSMVFGVLELTNFANGSFYILGAYLTLTFMTAFYGNFYIAFLLSIVATGCVGALMDRVTLRPMRKKGAPGIAAVIATIGFSEIINNSALVFFGTETKPFPNIFKLGKIKVGGVIITYLQIIIFVVAVILMLVLSILVYRTKIGKAMQATAQNTSAARLMGINVNHIITFTFFIGTLLAAVAGTLVAMYVESVSVSLSSAISMKTFAAAVLGGVGSLPGAMIGGVLLGLVETIVAGYVSSGYRDAIAFIILIVVLIFRPAGLLGKKVQSKV